VGASGLLALELQFSRSRRLCAPGRRGTVLRCRRRVSITIISKPSQPATTQPVDSGTHSPPNSNNQRRVLTHSETAAVGLRQDLAPDLAVVGGECQ
jgi:hypothetical protein